MKITQNKEQKINTTHHAVYKKIKNTITVSLSTAILYFINDFSVCMVGAQVFDQLTRKYSN